MPAATENRSSQDRLEPESVNGGANENDEGAEAQSLQIDRDRIRVLTGGTEQAASFQIDGEDHTLGNALRYVIMKDPEVEFCGYSIPHPSEDKMNLRIQTYGSASVYDVLDRGLSNLIEMCDVIENKFTASKNDFLNKMQE